MTRATVITSLLGVTTYNYVVPLGIPGDTQNGYFNGNKSSGVLQKLIPKV
jgi:hypothetical protein